MSAFETRHVVTFEDTNVVGNVYYTNHLRWQGRCREMFLREHAAGLVDDLEHNLSVVTVRCSCEYLGELFAFDEVVVRMRLATLTQARMSMRFEYFRKANGTEQLVARGEQEIACMRREGERLVPAPWPPALAEAVERYKE